MASRSRLSLRILKWLIATALAGLTAGALFAGGLYLYLAPKLPDVDQLGDVQFQEPLRVYDNDGGLIAEYGSKRRIPLTIDEIPEQIQDAFIAAEDDRFYEHPGVDWMGIVRAAWNLVLTGEKGQGGSTITMQVARNFFLSREKTYLRKINEILLALKIERQISKKQILELYLNKIYLGQRAYGVGAAAQVYYGKPVDQLTLPETAMIAGLPKAPSRFNPVDNPSRATERRNYVLRRMHDLGMIDERTMEAARAVPVTAGSHSAPLVVDAPYVGEMARLEAVQRFGDDVYTGGYSVYTTVDGDRQGAAIHALRKALIDYERRHGYKGPVGSVEARLLPDADTLRAAIAAPDPGSSAESEDNAPPPGVPGEATGPLTPKQLDAELASHGDYGNLEPGIVIEVEDQRVLVYRSEGRLDPIPWKEMQWAAPRLASGAVGDKPEKPADVLAPGDIVYVAASDQGPGLELAQRPGVEGAIVSLDPHDGAIRSLVGGFDFRHSKFNRVTQARRQPGSNFKPFVYSAAVNKGYTAATLVNDAPIVFDDPALEDTWRPENYSGKVFGPTRLREGLVHSRNLVSIRVLLDIGIPYAIRYVQRFGFPEDQLPHDLTLALGSASLSPMQVVTGYAVFANMGYRVEPYLVQRIEDDEGNVIYRANPARVCPEPCAARQEADAGDDTAGSGKPDAGKDAAAQGETDADGAAVSETPMEAQDRPAELAAVGVPDEKLAPKPRFAPRVIDERNAYIVRSFLRDVARRGTGRGTRVLGRDDIGGKTGTTDDQLDAWFSGFNSSVVTTAWVGFDAMKSLGRYETGARAALPMWIDYMRTALRGTPETWPELPPGMVTVRIDPETGKYAGSGADHTMLEIFRSENAPTPPPAGTTASDGGSGNGSGGEQAPLF